MQPDPDPMQRLFELARASLAEHPAPVAPSGFASKVLRQFSKPVGLDSDIGILEGLAVRFFLGALALAVVSVCAPLFKGERQVAPEEAAATEIMQVAFLER